MRGEPLLRARGASAGYRGDAVVRDRTASPRDDLVSRLVRHQHLLLLAICDTFYWPPVRCLSSSQGCCSVHRKPGCRILLL